MIFFSPLRPRRTPANSKTTSPPHDIFCIILRGSQTTYLSILNTNEDKILTIYVNRTFARKTSEGYLPTGITVSISYGCDKLFFSRSIRDPRKSPILFFYVFSEARDKRK